MGIRLRIEGPKQSVFLSFFLVALTLSLCGCESASSGKAKASSSRSDGIVQARISDDGIPQLAIAMAPRRPGEEAPDLSGLRGVNLFDWVDSAGAKGNQSGIRAQIWPNRPVKYGGVLSFGYAARYLENMRLKWAYESDHTAGVANDPDAPENYLISYASSPYAAFDHYLKFSSLPSGTQTVTFSHGVFQAKLEITRAGDTIYARINDGEPQIAYSFPGTQDKDVWQLAVFLPLEDGLTPLGLGLDEQKEVMGKWTVSGDPQFSDKMSTGGGEGYLWGANEPGAGSTPFEFTLKSLIVKDIKAAYNPDVPDPETGELYSGGATFTGTAKFLVSDNENDVDNSLTGFEGYHARLAYKAQIFRDGGEYVRTIYGSVDLPEANLPPPLNETITVEWDGKDNYGNPVSAEERYGIAITAMLDDNPEKPAEEAEGYIYTLVPGVGPDALSPAFFDGEGELQVYPEVYIPYTTAEVNNYSEDPETGELQWNDSDGDGIPDWPDHDGDGGPDFEPGEDPPPIEIYEDFYKAGYETNWELHVYAEDENGDRTEILSGYDRDTNQPPPWTGKEDVLIEWQPPLDLEAHKIIYAYTLFRCRDLTPDLDTHVRWQTVDQDPSTCPKLDGEVAQTANNKPVLEILEGNDKIATSEDDPRNLSLEGIMRHSKIREYSRWKIKLSNIDKNKPNILSVTIQGAVDGESTTVQVKDADRPENRDGIYEGLSPESSAAFLSTNSSSYTSGYVMHREDRELETDPEIRAFDELLSTNLSRFFSTLWGPGLGELDYLTTVEDSPNSQTLANRLVAKPTIAPNRTVGSKENFTKFGFEDVKFSFEGLDAIVKTQNKASQVMLTVHGGDDSLLDLTKFVLVTGSTRDIFLRQKETFNPLLDMAPLDKSHIKTLILASCNVLDAYDYNNVRVADPKVPSRTSPDDPVRQGSVLLRTRPGFAWWSATRYTSSGSNAGPILLGYNYPASQAKIATVMEKYAKELNRLHGLYDDSVIQQYAWLKANAQITHFAFKGSTRNACAWDEKHYYYISYADPVRGRPVFVRIPLDRLPEFSSSPGGKLASPMGATYTYGVPGVDPADPGATTKIEIR